MERRREAQKTQRERERDEERIETQREAHTQRKEREERGGAGSPASAVQPAQSSQNPVVSKSLASLGSREETSSPLSSLSARASAFGVASSTTTLDVPVSPLLRSSIPSLALVLALPVAELFLFPATTFGPPSAPFGAR